MEQELHSGWSKGLGRAKTGCEERNVSLPQELTDKSMLGHLDAMLQGSLLAVLEVHQKRVEELHGEVLQRLCAIEARLLPARGSVCEESVQEEPEELEVVKPACTDHVVRDLTTVTNDTVEPTPAEQGLARAWQKLRNSLRGAVRSNHFEVLVSCLIGLSVALSFLELEWEGYLAEVKLGLQPPGRWQGAGRAFGILGSLFNTIFLMEFLLRCVVVGRRYLMEGWAWFDAFFVLSALLDDLGGAFLEEDGGRGVSVVRLVRCARLVRALRTARGMRSVQPLILLVQTILGSLGALFWSSVLLFLVQLMGTIFVTKSLHSFVMDESNLEEDRLWVNRIFGSGLRGIYTFFEITFSGGWPNHVRPLIAKAGAGYALFFVPYIAVWTFVIMRVISALFIKQTLAMAEKVEARREAQRADRRRIMRTCAAYFKTAERDRNGRLTWEELQYLFQDPAVQNWCESNEILVEDAESLWNLLSHERSITVAQFVDGMLQMRGPAKAIDLKTLLQSTNHLATQLEVIHEKVLAMDKPPPRRSSVVSVSISRSPCPSETA